MESQQMSFGSGSQLLGGTSPFQQILQAQSQGDAGALQQQTPNSMGFDPSTGQIAQPMSPQPPQAPQPQQAPPSPQQAMQAGQPMPQSFEAQTILEALSKRLSDNSSIQKKKIDMGVID